MPPDDPRGSRYIINGEPTENRLALGSKGVLRYEAERHRQNGALRLSRTGRFRHRQAARRARRASAAIELPTDDLLGPSTLNIGTLSGGRAPNVIADEARAEIMIRLVGDSAATKAALERAVAGRAELRECPRNSRRAVSARIDGIPTTVVAFTTDIPGIRRRSGASRF